MKILHVADLHYDLRKYDWVVEAAAHVDVVVLAGDHLELSSSVPLPAQAVVVQKYFQYIRAQKPLLICSGNHDLDTRDENGERVARWIEKARYINVSIDGDSKAVGDTLFTMCPWWDGQERQKAIAAQLAFDATFRPSRWIWVYHAPPTGSPTSWAGNRSEGDAVVRGWIEEYQPDLVLSGHIHQSPFITNGSWADRIGKTWVFNTGHQVGPVPSHVVIDTDGPRAYWLSLTSEQTAALAEPLQRPLPRLGDLPPWLEPMVEMSSRHLR